MHYNIKNILWGLNLYVYFDEHIYQRIFFIQNNERDLVSIELLILQAEFGFRQTVS